MKSRRRSQVAFGSATLLVAALALLLARKGETRRARAGSAVPREISVEPSASSSNARPSTLDAEHTPATPAPFQQNTSTLRLELTCASARLPIQGARILVTAESGTHLAHSRSTGSIEMPGVAHGRLHISAERHGWVMLLEDHDWSGRDVLKLELKRADAAITGTVVTCDKKIPVICNVFARPAAGRYRKALRLSMTTWSGGAFNFRHLQAGETYEVWCDTGKAAPVIVTAPAQGVALEFGPETGVVVKRGRAKGWLRVMVHSLGEVPIRPPLIGNAEAKYVPHRTSGTMMTSDVQAVLLPQPPGEYVTVVRDDMGRQLGPIRFEIREGVEEVEVPWSGDGQAGYLTLTNSAPREALAMIDGPGVDLRKLRLAVNESVETMLMPGRYCLVSAIPPAATQRQYITVRARDRRTISLSTGGPGRHVRFRVLPKHAMAIDSLTLNFERAYRSGLSGCGPGSRSTCLVLFGEQAKFARGKTSVPSLDFVLVDNQPATIAYEITVQGVGVFRGTCPKGGGTVELRK